MNTPKGKHAYLVLHDQVFNRDVTWTTGFYPDYTLEQILDSGENVTSALLEQVLGITEDIYNFQRQVKKHFGNQGVALTRHLYNKINSY